MTAIRRHFGLALCLVALALLASPASAADPSPRSILHFMDQDPLNDIANVCRPLDGVHRCDATGALFDDDCADEDGVPLGSDTFLLTAQGGLLSTEGSRFFVKFGRFQLQSCQGAFPGQFCCDSTSNRSLLCTGQVPEGTYRVVVNDITANDIPPIRNALACSGLTVNVRN